jgi:hypothetical protein
MRQHGGDDRGGEVERCLLNGPAVEVMLEEANHGKRRLRHSALRCRNSGTRRRFAESFAQLLVRSAPEAGCRHQRSPAEVARLFVGGDRQAPSILRSRRAPFFPRSTRDPRSVGPAHGRSPASCSTSPHGATGPNAADERACRDDVHLPDLLGRETPVNSSFRSGVVTSRSALPATRLPPPAPSPSASAPAARSASPWSASPGSARPSAAARTGSAPTARHRPPSACACVPAPRPAA